MDIIAARGSEATTPPADAVIPERAAEAPGPGCPIPSHYRLCFGCGTDHESGLHIRMATESDLSVEARFVVTEHHQGAPGLAHGGVLAAAVDEVMGASNWLLMTPAVTARLEVDFQGPVPVGSSVLLRAAIVGRAGRKVYTVADGRTEAGAVLHARGMFLQVPLEHFSRHGRPEDVERAAEAGSPQPWLEINP